MEKKHKILIEISVGILIVAIGLLGYDNANGKGDQDHIITYWTVVSLAIMIMLSSLLYCKEIHLKLRPFLV